MTSLSYRPVKPSNLVSIATPDFMAHTYQDSPRLRECMETADSYHALENCLMDMVLQGKIYQTTVKTGDVGLVIAMTKFDLPNPITLARFKFCMVLFDKNICVLDERCLKVIS